MNKEELAVKLDGSEYPLFILKDLCEEAKKSGLVIVYGESDDLMEFRGAIDEEVGAWEGVNISVSKNGIIQDWNSFIECEPVEDECRNYFLKKSQSRPIKAIWGEGEYSWTYKTEIPHACFDVIRDGEKYCRGIVFHVGDIFRPAMNERKNSVIQALKTIKGDDLYRARMAFKNLTPEQMNQEYGQSGKTCAQIIAEYEEHESRVNALIDWVSRQTGE